MATYLIGSCLVVLALGLAVVYSQQFLTFCGELAASFRQRLSTAPSFPTRAALVAGAYFAAAAFTYVVLSHDELSVSEFFNRFLFVDFLGGFVVVWMAVVGDRPILSTLVTLQITVFVVWGLLTIVVTKRTLFLKMYAAFLAVLLTNVGGCLWAGSKY